MGQEALLDETEAAEELGVTKATLANWSWRRHGPAFLKIGRRVMYLANDVDDWRMAQRHDPSEAAS